MRAHALIAVGLLTVLPSAAAPQDAERTQYREACEDGDASACNTLGLIYEAGGGADDRALASDFYERACDGGVLRGCTNLGILLEARGRRNRNLDRVVGLYRTACGGGETLACDRLRSMEAAGLVAASGPSAVSGRIVDAETGNVLEDVLLTVPTLGVQAISDASGRFRLPELPAGEHHLTVERMGYEGSERDLTLPGAPDLLILMDEAEVGDLSAPGRVVGRVMEDGGRRALPDVEVSVAGQGRARTLSNQQGRFTLRDVEPGLLEVQFEHLGYASRAATLVLQPARTVEVAATLATQAIELEPIQVTVYSSFLEQNGFYDRERRGFGRHFDARDLQTINPIQVSDVLWRVPGVRLQYGDLGEVRAVFRRRRCVLPVFIDGVPSPDTNLDQVPPEWLEAMEVYYGVGTPIQYARGPDPCGAVLFWTRR